MPRFSLAAIAARIRGARQMARGRTARRGYLALADQAVVSGAAFLVSVMLARYCGGDEYGVYVLAVSAMLLLNGITGPLVTEPMTVLGAPLSEERFRRYAASLGLAQLAAGAACAALVFIAAWLWPRERAAELGGALAGMAAAVLFFLYRDFLRRVLLARLRVAAALANDLCFCVPMVAGVHGLHRLGALDARHALLLMAAAGGLSCAVGLAQTGLLERPRLADIRAALRDNWAYGRWGLGVSIFFFGYAQAQTFILASFWGPGASGQMDAARNIVAPAQMLSLAALNVCTPRAAALFARAGRERLTRFVMRAMLVLLACAGVLGLGVVFFSDRLLELFYRERYLDQGGAVVLWAGIYFFAAGRVALGSGIQAMRRPDLIFAALAAAAAVTLALSFLLVPALAIKGALWARLGGEAALIGLMLGLFRKRGIEKRPVVRDTSEPVPAAAAA